MAGRQEASLVDYRDKLIVKPGHKLRLKDVDPAFTGQHETPDEAAPELGGYQQRLTQLQGLLYAEKKHAVLIVLQGLDAAGKDGTMKHVFGALNPQGASVANFKEPTPIERDHDFLWRIHPHAPPKGWLAIFNRSHYEDVLVTRVHKLIGKQTCEARYESIRAFELSLQESGTTILKFFLHISKEEQLARFGKRLDDPFRNWKISESDYSERLLWDDYMRAAEKALAATSTHAAPWYVIPANHKWFRNLAVSQIVADTMEELGMEFPKPAVDLAEIRSKYHAAAMEECGDGKEMARRGKSTKQDSG
ncbi:MAG TPA: polyphosphate kinase 2 family protein [Methylocella sp.]|nr:polyphosphate kinase 2 family protein [Methylocella sp.]